jgi:hypothetical protein
MEVMLLQRQHRQLAQQQHHEQLGTQQHQQQQQVQAQPTEQRWQQQQLPAWSPLALQHLASVDVWDAFFDATLADYQRLLVAGLRGRPCVFTHPSYADWPELRAARQRWREPQWAHALREHHEQLRVMSQSAAVLALVPRGIKRRPAHITGLAVAVARRQACVRSSRAHALHTRAQKHCLMPRTHAHACTRTTYTQACSWPSWRCSWASATLPACWRCLAGFTRPSALRSRPCWSSWCLRQGRTQSAALAASRQLRQHSSGALVLQALPPAPV